MNEKYLWELWEKCKHPHPKYGGGDMVWPMEFAELIVRECMEQVWYCREDVINSNISEVIKDRIKEHFGVEE